jgi:hypothetical protein
MDKNAIWTAGAVAAGIAAAGVIGLAAGETRKIISGMNKKLPQKPGRNGGNRNFSGNSTEKVYSRKMNDDVIAEAVCRESGLY